MSLAVRMALDNFQQLHPTRRVEEMGDCKILSEPIGSTFNQIFGGIVEVLDETIAFSLRYRSMRTNSSRLIARSSTIASTIQSESRSSEGHHRDCRLPPAPRQPDG